MKRKEQVYNFCTLFDSHYLIRGMVLYESMKNTGDQFHLYIFALDKLCEDVLNSISLEDVTVIGIDEFENEDLKSIKKERTVAEYCWTCTSYSIDYIFSHYPVEEITYLDADLYFFDKPSILINEFRDSGNDVLLIEHRYSPDLAFKEQLYGKYNVEFMTFCKTKIGIKTLSWWKEKCRVWCYARLEEGKFGDQKYLECFEDLFSGTYVCNNIGAGVAPWNVTQYKITVDNDHKPLIDGNHIVFYHFHELYWGGRKDIDLGHGYGEFADSILCYIYEPYIDALEEAVLRVRKKHPDFAYLYDSKHLKKLCVFDDETLNTTDVLTVIKQLNPSEKDIYIWGAGNNGKRLLAFFTRYHIDVKGIIDTYKTESMLGGITISEETKIKDKKYFIIVTPHNYRDPIITKLYKWGYREYTGYITYEFLEKVIDQKLSEKIKN